MIFGICMNAILRNTTLTVIVIFALILTAGCIGQKSEVKDIDAASSLNDLKDLNNKTKEQPIAGLNFEFILPKKGQAPPQEVPEGLQSAMDDYAWRLNLVSEQTARLDMYYATKAGTSMTPQEFKGWLDALKNQTDEFMKRNNDAITSGRVYIKYLNAEYQNLDYDWYSREHTRITRNEDIMKSDIQKAIINYNQNVAKYNSEFIR